MLHRISIFDLATLEMMNKSKCIILSNIGGNPEFNKDNNIITTNNAKAVYKRIFNKKLIEKLEDLPELKNTLKFLIKKDNNNKNESFKSFEDLTIKDLYELNQLYIQNIRLIPNTQENNISGELIDGGRAECDMSNIIIFESIKELKNQNQLPETNINNIKVSELVELYKDNNKINNKDNKTNKNNNKQDNKSNIENNNQLQPIKELFNNVVEIEGNDFDSIIKELYRNEDNEDNEDSESV